jgi:glycosyltransferase involved in cell wall biosynthesis
MVKVCVAVPVYNEEKHIEQTLLSLKSQSYDDVIFLVSDNASTDSTWNICKSVAGQDPRFVLLKNEDNIGALNNFEKVLRNSSSDYFMWLGGHDYISSNYIENAANSLDLNPSLSMVCGMPIAVKEGHPDRLLESSVYKFTHKKLGRYLQAVREISDCTIVHSLFRRYLLDGFSFRATTGPDIVMLSRMLWYGQLSYMPQEQYFRRYFDAKPQTYEERIVGRPCRLSFYDFICYFLDDFSLLYNGDPRMKSYLESEIIEALAKKQGIQCLLPNDEI